MTLTMTVRGGSSPLARGKRVVAADMAGLSGIIPACAGETCGQRSGAGQAPDHPRLRGGNGAFLVWPTLSRGSSPLARGKPALTVSTRVIIRIIPACAGETSSLNCATRSGRDHPRLRGGNLPPLPVEVGVYGSSLLARGKQEPRGHPLLHAGIIPACAGETGSSARRHRRTSDHPRLRGGNGVSVPRHTASSGSSPLARGKLHVVTVQRQRLGIIPACAGETRPRSWARPRRPDHPRLRGGNDGRRWETPLGAGSSPLARGKLTRWCVTV